MRIGSTWRKNGTKVTVTEVIPYPEYNNPPYDKDVAVMKISEPLQFDACTQPIALPAKGLSASYGEVITVSGWGRTKVCTYEYNVMTQFVGLLISLLLVYSRS